MSSTQKSDLAASGARKKFKIGLIQLAVENDKHRNIKNAEQKIKEAAARGADLVMLPECWNCPYGNKYFPQYAESAGDSLSWESMARAAKDSGIYLVAGSIPERDGDKLYNTSISFDRSGNILAKHR